MIKNQGFSRIILSVGYKKEKVIKYLQNKHDIEIVFSKENNPLGTGGAIIHAKKYIHSDNFIVMNGDTFININFLDLYNYHMKFNSHLTIVGAESKSDSGYGSMRISENNLILNFNEKPTKTNNNHINAGVYVFNKKVMKLFPKKKKFSIEKDFFSKNDEIRMLHYNSESDLYDVGTPERLINFKKYINFFNE